MAEKQKQQNNQEEEQAAQPEVKSETKTQAQPTDELAEMKALAQRIQANFENYRKQTEKRVEDLQEMAAKGIILQLLPIIDNFDLALKNQENSKTEDLLQGIKLIHEQLHQVLQDNGVKNIDTTNQKFDPHLHEALMKEPSEQPEGTILEEFQKGFILHDKIIRHARVKISAGKSD